MAVQTTTVEQAIEALASARKAYSPFGYCDATERDLVHLLTTDRETLVAEGKVSEYDSVGEAVRNRIWSLGGGSTSAIVTIEAFTILGRFDETETDWI